MTNEPKAGGGLDPEMLAAYIDKRLPPDERAVVEAKLATDPDSYELLVELIHANEALNGETAADGDATEPAERAEPQGRTGAVVPIVSASAGAGRFGGTSPKLASVTRASAGGPKPKRTGGWMIAGGVLAAAAAVVLVVRLQPELWQRWRGGDAVDPQLAKLVAAVGEERYIEARLTGGFKYGPLRSVTRSSGDLARQNLALLSASAELQQAVKVAPTPANMAALGVALLQLGSLDDAIQQLELATRMESRPEMLVNLAAAYYARAEINERDADLSLALQTVENALARSPGLSEGLFNRALILEKFNLTTTALEAWDAFLSVDSSSQWADEARRHRALLQAQSALPVVSLESALAEVVNGGAGGACALVERDGQLARELVEDLLLPRWGDQILASQDRAASDSLDLAARISACAASAYIGDLTARAVNAIQSSDERGRRELARAHQLWRLGRAGYAKSAPAEFLSPFAEAGRLFELHRSPLVAWVKQYEIGALFYAGDLAKAIERTRALESDSRVVHGGALWARLQWNKASINFQRASFGDALVEYRAALAAFEATGEREHVVAMHQSLAETYGRLGLTTEAWRQHREALVKLGYARDYRRIHSAITAPGYTAYLADQPGASLEFFREGLSRSIAAGNLNYQFECEVGVGRALVALGRDGEAQPFLQQALNRQAQVTNPSLRARLASDVYIGLADMAMKRGDGEAALTLADEAIASVAAAASEYRLAALHLSRGRALRQLGRFVDSARAFEAGIEVLESKRALLQQATQRISYTDRAWDLYAEIIGLVAIDLRDPPAALRWTERSRARSLHDTRPGERDPVGRLLTEPLPEGVAILVLADTERGLLSWLISGQTIAFHHEVDLHAVRDLASSSGGVDQELLAAGYDKIARPFAAPLARVRRVTVVPDWSTQTIPFAALVDRAARVPWVVSVTLNVAPSVAMAVAGFQSTAGLPPASIAVVTSDTRDQRSTVPLPGAVAESRRLAAIYPRSKALRAADLSVRTLREVMDGADVLHVAMHATADGRYLNQMTLGIRDERSGGWLNPETVFEDGALAPRLVILAACRTARGPLLRGEILLSLARPFLIAGAANVLVTLWDVPDRATEGLMVSFHSAVAAGVEPAEALARAQRAVVAAPGSDPPWWSAFVLVTTG